MEPFGKLRVKDDGFIKNPILFAPGLVLSVTKRFAKNYCNHMHFLICQTPEQPAVVDIIGIFNIFTDATVCKWNVTTLGKQGREFLGQLLPDGSWTVTNGI